MENLDFGEALDFLKNNQRIARVGWNGHHTLTLQVPDEHSKMTQPYIYMTTEAGARVPWCPSQTDLLSDDWMTVE